MSFPIVRNRRLRGNAAIRNLVRENQVTVNDLVQPIFVTHGTNVKSEIASMPGVYHFSLDRLKEEIDEITKLGIQAILLFGVPNTKDAIGTSAFMEDGIVQQAARSIKELNPNLLIIADTCFVSLRIQATAVLFIIIRLQDKRM